MLVENSDHISKLYGKTLHARNDAAEVERQLGNVESGQAELEHWLERYEREVDEMVGRMGGEGGSGVDGERERTYVSSLAVEMVGA